MRSEQQILDLVVGTVRDDARIRAVVMEGSRANPAMPRDVFRDYDMVYVVTDVAAFRTDGGWIDRFGQRMIMQLPDDMSGEPERTDGGYCSPPRCRGCRGRRRGLGPVPGSRRRQLPCRDTQPPGTAGPRRRRRPSPEIAPPLVPRPRSKRPRPAEPQPRG
jgi:aminoglycoside 6-adenylyltransferase